jgi:RNA polymerase sigma-70 factor (ECF subfamily)
MWKGFPRVKDLPMSNKYYLQLEDKLKTEQEEGFSDEELVGKSLKNPKLFELFVDKYQDVFMRTAFRVLKNKEDSEDAVQNAFVKIYINAKKYKKKPGIAFKSWAFRVLLNCVFTRYRKLKKRAGEGEYMDELLYSQEENIDSTFERKEKRDEIESILDEMPEDLSALMREHYLADRPYVEVAKSHGLTIAALKMKLFRARKKFKEIAGDL